MKKSSLRDRLSLLNMQAIIIGLALLLIFFAAGVRFGGYLQKSGGAYDGEAAAMLTIDVKGAVTSSGLYQFAAGSRVSDALAELPLSADAATELLNQAACLVDGTELIIPFAAGEIDWNALALSSVSAYYGTSSMAAADTADTPAIGMININSASSEQLQLLSGIGPSKAQSIINYREDYGPFLTSEQIMNVSGIGNATFERIKEHICVE